MAIVFLTTDLMSVSRINQAVRECGAMMTMVGTVDDVISQCQTGNVRLVLADLSASGCAIGELASRVRDSQSPDAAIVAFGPHVHVALLQAAHDAGCDEVITRGQFDAKAEEMIRRYV